MLSVLWYLHVVAGRRGKGGQWELGKRPKSEQLTLSMGPARVEVHSYVQREELPVRERGLSKH